VEFLALGLQLANQLVEVALPRADRAQGDNFGLPLLGDIRYGARLFVDLQTDEQCASLCPG
jgi:hypothetical protein